MEASDGVVEVGGGGEEWSCGKSCRVSCSGRRFELPFSVSSCFFIVFYCFICTPGKLHMYTPKKNSFYMQHRPVVAVPHMCPQTTIYMSSYYYVFVRILLSLVRVRILLYIHICPQTTIYVSSYCSAISPHVLSPSPITPALRPLRARGWHARDAAARAGRGAIASERQERKVCD
jgi:hypothetical protein